MSDAVVGGEEDCGIAAGVWRKGWGDARLGKATGLGFRGVSRLIAVGDEGVAVLAGFRISHNTPPAKHAAAAAKSSLG